MRGAPSPPPPKWASESRGQRCLREEGYESEESRALHHRNPACRLGLSTHSHVQSRTATLRKRAGDPQHRPSRERILRGTKKCASPRRGWGANLPRRTYGKTQRARRRAHMRQHFIVSPPRPAHRLAPRGTGDAAPRLCSRPSRQLTSVPTTPKDNPPRARPPSEPQSQSILGLFDDRRGKRELTMWDRRSARQTGRGIGEGGWRGVATALGWEPEGQLSAFLTSR